MEPGIPLPRGGEADTSSAPPAPSNLSMMLCETREHLATSIASVRAESFTKHNELSTKIAESRELLLAKFMELSTQMVGLAKRVDDVNTERDRTRWKIKYGVSVLSILLTIGSYYGYRDFFRSIRETVNQKVQEEIRKGLISDDRSFYNDLVAGNALDATQQYAPATLRLMSCFREGHYYDSAVLLPLLDSIYKNDDWDNAKAVFDVLEKSDPQYERVRDHTVLALIGSIQIQAALIHRDWLEKGFSTLKMAQILTPPGDIGTLNIIHTNYWVYDIQRQDWKSADTEIDAIKQLDSSVYTWETVKRWRFFVQYFGQSGNKQFEPRISAMWSLLRHRVSAQ